MGTDFCGERRRFNRMGKDGREMGKDGWEGRDAGRIRRRGLPSRSALRSKACGPAPPYQGGQLFFPCGPAALKCCDARFFEGDSYFDSRGGSTKAAALTALQACLLCSQGSRGVAPCCNLKGLQPWKIAGRIFEVTPGGVRLRVHEVLRTRNSGRRRGRRALPYADLTEAFGQRTLRGFF